MKDNCTARIFTNFMGTKATKITYDGERTFFVQGDPNLNLNGVRMHEGEVYEVFPNDYIEIYKSGE